MSYLVVLPMRLCMRPRSIHSVSRMPLALRGRMCPSETM
jgi:hypothetical protein